MGLIHDLVVKLEVLQNHKAVLEPYNSIGILSEALSFSQPQSSTETTHSNVHSLGCNDVFFDSWNKGYVVQPTMWNNTETQLFRITTGWLELDGEVVASMLVA
jgi:hypothetical protein